MATITYRRLNANGDPLHGNGQANFLSDADAVAQAIATRLKFLKGEWWENLSAGTPLFQNLLGVARSGKSPEVAALILTQRILGTPYVTSVSNVTTSYDATKRAFSFTCQVNTQFGPLTVSSTPASASLAASSLSFLAVAIASAEALGAITIKSDSVGSTQNLTATGILSAETFGTYTLNRAAIQFTLTGIVSGEAFGSPTLAAAGGSSNVASQIYNDMGTNEQHPYGVPSSYSFYTGADMDVGNNLAAYGATAVEWWNALYPGQSGNTATNTLVNVRNMKMLWLRNSSKTWTTINLTYSQVDSDQFSADWTTDYNTQVANKRQESDGSYSFNVVNGRVAHCYAPYPRIPVDNTDFAGIIAYCEARLVLLNTGGTDDRASANFVLDCGVDPYQSPTGAGIQNNPNIALGKFKDVTTSWRSFAATTCTLAQLQAYPPPLDLTGIGA